MLRYIFTNIIRITLSFFSCIIPINKKKIFFSTFKKGQFSCSPKYIFLELNNQLPDLRYIWCLGHDSLELSMYPNVTVVKPKTLIWIYHFLTAKVIIINTRLRLSLPCRENQIVINTWHGGGAYKRVGVESYPVNKENYWRKKAQSKGSGLSTKSTAYFISSSKVFSDVIHESINIPYNKYLPVGLPRNDIFFRNNDALIISLKNKLNISHDFGVVLYAPTYRGRHSFLASQSAMELDVNKLKNILSKKFKKEFYVLFRGHPSFSKNVLYCDGAMNVSSYPDMQELLLITDVLITDYSSSIWDFSLTKKPGFLFTPDLDIYLSQDRGFHRPIEQWPYPYAKTNDELCDHVINFDEMKHEARIKKYLDDMGSYEQGTATSKIVDLLQNILQ